MCHLLLGGLATGVVVATNFRTRVRVDKREVITLTLLVAFCLVGLEATPELKEFSIIQGGVGIVASLLLPGYLLLLIAKITPQRKGQLAMYAVAVSTAFLLLLGAMTYVVGSVVDVERPLEAMPWVLGLSLVLLSAGAYTRSAGSSLSRRSFSVSFRPLFSAVLLVLLPLASVAATSAINAGESTLPMLLQIVLLCGVVVLLLIGAIPPNLRPFAVWSVSIAVLWQMTFISPHIWGWDIHFEYFTAQEIFQGEDWTPASAGPTNSLLSVTFLAAVYASVTGLELVWVYKLVYPLIASLLPVAIYYLALAEFDDEWVATLSPFALIFYYGYFKIMPDKQIISQVFLALVLVTIFDNSVRGTRKKVLAATFGTMLIFSHYGTSLLFIGVLAATIVVVAVAKRLDVVDGATPTVLSPLFIAFLAVEWIIWYLFSAAGENFDRIASVLGALLTQNLGSSGRSGIGYATKTFESPTWMVYKFLVAALVGLICIGVLWMLYSAVTRRDNRTHFEYTVFSALLVSFLVSSVLLTYNVGFDRTLLLVLVALPPFAVVGLRTLLSLGPKVSDRISTEPSSKAVASVFTIFLVALFFFSSGAAFAVAGEDVPAYSINLEKDAGWPVYERSEVAATRWLDENARPESRVVVYNQWSALKSRDALLVREVISSDQIVYALPNTDYLGSGQYVYISDKPMVQDVDDRVERVYINPEETRFYRRHVVGESKIYSSGDAQIYRSD
ncbi:Uncharacterized membrane protein [Halogranum rubrum]|uniref:Uncharacterized membrane protein n=1 Tax=Halogranum rubrum TaxID=553466 RepID=A0A1I4IR66_9EURY|nr:Uncharacterized membrane protein [Halogranum rubrum]